MPVEIVKVQRPIVSNDPDDPWLIYDKARKHECEVPDAAIPKHVRKAMGSDFKAYFKGTWSSIVGWGLSVRVNAQDW